MNVAYPGRTHLRFDDIRKIETNSINRQRQVSRDAVAVLRDVEERSPRLSKLVTFFFFFHLKIKKTSANPRINANRNSPPAITPSIIIISPVNESFKCLSACIET